MKKKVEHIESYINDVVDDLNKKANKIYNARINEVYANIDMWISDVSFRTENLKELTSIIDDIMVKKQKIESELMTSDAMIEFLLNTLQRVNVALKDFIPEIKERELHANKLKMSIQAMFD